MSQTPEEKTIALISVLPLLHAHLGLICDVRSGLGNLTPNIPDGPPRYVATCHWRCPDCAELWALRPQCPPDESWVRVSRALASRYRLYAVARSLDALNDYRRMWARAVYYQHIEPWRQWCPAAREDWAHDGVSWMAKEIPGDVPMHGPGAAPRVTLSIEVRALRVDGLSHRQIAKRVGVSKDTVRRLLAYGGTNGA